MLNLNNISAASSEDTKRQYPNEGWRALSEKAILSLTNQIGKGATFKELYKTASQLRIIAAIKLKHPGDGFGKARTTVVCETFFYDIGAPLGGEAWRETKNAVLKNVNKLCKDAKPPTNVFELTHSNSDELSATMFSQTTQQVLDKLKQAGYNSIQSSIQACMEDINACPYRQELNLALVHLNDIQLATTPGQDYLTLNSNNPLTDLILTKGFQPGMLALYGADEARDTKQAVLRFINTSAAKNKGVFFKKLKIELPQALTRFEDAIRLIQEASTQKEIANTAFARLDILFKRFPESIYEVARLQPYINPDKENAQPPLSGQIIAAHYLDGKPLSIAFAAADLTAEHWKYAQFCYEKILKAPLNTENFMAYSGKLMYALAHMIPVLRGNAGMMQWILSSLANHCYIVLGNLKPSEISWDFMAISATQEDFSKYWESAFEPKPRAAKFYLTVPLEKLLEASQAQGNKVKSSSNP